MRFAPSILHPVTWWLLGVSMVISATLSRNFVFLISISSIAIGLMAASQKPHKAEATIPGLGFYLTLAVLVVVSRLLFRLIFNYSSSSGDAVLVLPVLEVELGFGDPVQLLGTISKTNLIAATVDGLRLAAIILSIGLAATLANPRKLLRSTPAVLFEIATAVSMAINLVPQLMRSFERIKSARRLRGRSSKVGALSGNVIPVLEDAIESSMNLAASMAARGFGQQNTPRVRLASGLLALSGVVLIAIGGFLITASDSKFVWVLFMGLAGSLASVVFSSFASNRTKHTKQKIRLQDYLIVFASTLLLTLASIGPLL